MRVWELVHSNSVEDLLREICPTMITWRGFKAPMAPLWVLTLLTFDLPKRPLRAIIKRLCEENGSIGDQWWVELCLTARSTGSTPYAYTRFMVAVVDLKQADGSPVFPKGIRDIYIDDELFVSLHNNAVKLAAHDDKVAL